MQNYAFGYATGKQSTPLDVSMVNRQSLTLSMGGLDRLGVKILGNSSCHQGVLEINNVKLTNIQLTPFFINLTLCRYEIDGVDSMTANCESRFQLNIGDDD